MQEGATGGTTLAPVITVMWVVLGIIFSLLVPVFVRVLKQAVAKSEKPAGRAIADVWNKYGGNRYLKILVAATGLAVALVFLLDLQFSAARDAALAGFAWESLTSKLVGGASG